MSTFRNWTLNNPSLTRLIKLVLLQRASFLSFRFLFLWSFIFRNSCDVFGWQKFVYPITYSRDSSNRQECRFDFSQLSWRLFLFSVIIFYYKYLTWIKMIEVKAKDDVVCSIYNFSFLITRLGQQTSRCQWNVLKKIQNIKCFCLIRRKIFVYSFFVRSTTHRSSYTKSHRSRLQSEIRMSLRFRRRITLFGQMVQGRQRVLSIRSTRYATRPSVCLAGCYSWRRFFFVIVYIFSSF